MVATCKWEGCKDEIRRGGGVSSPRMKLRGSGSNIRPLWLGWSRVGMGWGLDMDKWEEVGDEGDEGASLPDRQLVHRAAKCNGGRGGLNK